LMSFIVCYVIQNICKNIHFLVIIVVHSMLFEVELMIC
jgi:hypothetical protein